MAYSSIIYSGNGSQTTFAVPFPFLDRSHVAVTVGGVSTPFTWDSDSQIRCTTAPAAGTNNIRIKRTTVLTPLVTFSDGSTLTAANLNRAELQNLYILQEEQDTLSLSITLPDLPESYTVSKELPPIAARALKNVYFDASGAFAAGTPIIGGTTVSSAMIPVVTAATTALARTAMGPYSDAAVRSTGSTTDRTLAVRFAENVNVRDYGAVGDGVADDTAAIQAAVNTGKPVFIPVGVYKISSGIISTTALTLCGSGSCAGRTTITCAGTALTGWMVEPRDDYNIQGLMIVGNSLDGTYGIGTNYSASGGRTRIHDVYIYNVDEGIRFGANYSHNIGLHYSSIFVRAFRTCGINLADGSGAAASGESAWLFENCITSNPSSYIETSVTVTNNSPDTTHDALSWSGTPARFGWQVLRSANGTNGWHVPPNWTSPNFTATSFSALKSAGQTWYYKVVRGSRGISVRRGKDVAFVSCQTEYTGIGLFLESIFGFSVSGLYYEVKDAQDPRYCAIYASSSTGSITTLWNEGASYGVVSAVNSLLDISSTLNLSCTYAAIGQTGGTTGSVNYRAISLSATPAVFSAMTAGAFDYSRDASYIDTVKSEHTIDHTQLSRLSVAIRGVEGASIKADNATGLSTVTADIHLVTPRGSAPTYVKGAVYFDTTLNKLRVGGATAWETVTST